MSAQHNICYEIHHLDRMPEFKSRTILRDLRSAPSPELPLYIPSNSQHHWHSANCGVSHNSR